MTQLIEQLKRHEGIKLKPYKCTANKLTIGVREKSGRRRYLRAGGRNASTKRHTGSSKPTEGTLPWTLELDEVRLAALINFTFNVGIGTVSKFVNAMALLKAGSYDMAADEFLQSRWAKQVGQRAIEVTEQIRTGEWQ